MGNRVANAHVEFVVDFDNKEEAEKFVSENQKKGWWFVPLNNFDVGTNRFVRQDKYKENLFTVIVKKPYKNYRPSW